MKTKTRPNTIALSEELQKQGFALKPTNPNSGFSNILNVIFRGINMGRIMVRQRGMMSKNSKPEFVIIDHDKLTVWNRPNPFKSIDDAATFIKEHYRAGVI